MRVFFAHFISVSVVATSSAANGLDLFYLSNRCRHNYDMSISRIFRSSFWWVPAILLIVHRYFVHLLIVHRYFVHLQAVCMSNAGIFCAFHIRFRRCHFKRGKRTRFVLLRLVHVMIAISATRFNAHSSTTQDFPNNRNSTLNL